MRVLRSRREGRRLRIQRAPTAVTCIGSLLVIGSAVWTWEQLRLGRRHGWFWSWGDNCGLYTWGREWLTASCAEFCSDAVLVLTNRTNLCAHFFHLAFQKGKSKPLPSIILTISYGQVEIVMSLYVLVRHLSGFRPRD